MAHYINYYIKEKLSEEEGRKRQAIEIDKLQKKTEATFLNIFI